MVEIKYNTWLIRLIILCLNAFFCLLLFLLLFTVKPLGGVKLYTLCAFIFFLVSVPISFIFLYNFEKNFRIIFDNWGITIKNKIIIGSILFYDDVTFHLWEKVSDVYGGGLFGTFFLELNEERLSVVDIFLWGMFPIPRNVIIRLSCLMANKTEALEFALTKISADKCPWDIKWHIKEKRRKNNRYVTN